MLDHLDLEFSQGKPLPPKPVCSCKTQHVPRLIIYSAGCPIHSNMATRKAVGK